MWCYIKPRSVLRHMCRASARSYVNTHEPRLSPVADRTPPGVGVVCRLQVADSRAPVGRSFRLGWWVASGRSVGQSFGRSVGRTDRRTDRSTERLDRLHLPTGRLADQHQQSTISENIGKCEPDRSDDSLDTHQTAPKTPITAPNEIPLGCWTVHVLSDGDTCAHRRHNRALIPNDFCTVNPPRPPRSAGPPRG